MSEILFVQALSLWIETSISAQFQSLERDSVCSSLVEAFALVSDDFSFNLLSEILFVQASRGPPRGDVLGGGFNLLSEILVKSQVMNWRVSIS